MLNDLLSFLLACRVVGSQGASRPLPWRDVMWMEISNWSAGKTYEDTHRSTHRYTSAFQVPYL